MILRQIERINRSSAIDRLVVATSVDPSDDILARVVEQSGAEVRRGPLDDVLARFLLIVEEFDAQSVVRLTADNPLTDAAVIDQVIAVHQREDVDYTSNSLTRTYPYGLDVECVRSAALRYVAASDPDEMEREHVTIGVYRRPERFRIQQVLQDRDVSNLRWSVDYPEDFDFVQAVYSNLYDEDPGFGQDEVLAFIDSNPQFRRTVEDVDS